MDRRMKKKINLECKNCKIPFELIDADFNLRQRVYICRRCGYVKVFKAFNLDKRK